MTGIREGKSIVATDSFVKRWQFCDGGKYPIFSQSLRIGDQRQRKAL
jgi:hypothetical protein